eukprot:NODE_321_length_11054_cov_0.461524.p2 type:complete len:453 gc:universal NODE_321_length_11054_cov_0.461524:5363-6721(+)
MSLMSSKSDVLKKLNRSYQDKKLDSPSASSIEDSTSLRDLKLQKLELSAGKILSKSKSVRYEDKPQGADQIEYAEIFDKVSDISPYKFEPKSVIEKSPATPMNSDRAVELNELLELSNQHAMEIHSLQFELQKLQKKLSDTQPYVQCIYEHFGKISPQELDIELRTIKEQHNHSENMKDLVKSSEIQVSSEIQKLNVHNKLNEIEKQLDALIESKNDNFNDTLQKGLDKMIALSVNDSKRTIELTNQIVPQLAIQLKKQLSDSINTAKVIPLQNQLAAMQQREDQAIQSREYYKNQVSKLTRVMTSSLMDSYDLGADNELLLRDIQFEVQKAFQNNDLPNDWLINWIEKTSPEQASQSVSVMSDMLVELFAVPPPNIEFRANQETVQKAPLFHLLKAFLLKIYILHTKKAKVANPLSENELLDMVQKKIDVLQNSVNRKSNLLTHLGNKIES